MKVIILFTVLVMSYSTGFCQYFLDRPSGVAAGVSGGVSSRGKLIGNFSVGAQLNDHHMSLNLQALLSNDVKSPGIVEARYGRLLGSFELYGGFGYHIVAGQVVDHLDKYIKNPYGGFRPAFGVIKHFRNSLYTISAGASGSIFSLQLGMCGVR